MAILVRIGSSSKVLPLLPIAAHSYGAILVGVEDPSKVLPLQPISAQSYIAIQSGRVIPQKSSHCRLLQPTLTWQF